MQTPVVTSACVFGFSGKREAVTQCTKLYRSLSMADYTFYTKIIYIYPNRDEEIIYFKMVCDYSFFLYTQARKKSAQVSYAEYIWLTI